MDINKIIFESMISEALDKIQARSGSINDAVNEVANELNLTNKERSALAERARKVTTVTNEGPGEGLIVDEPGHSTALSTGNSLNFGSEDDMDQATGMLMYKGIPWKSKHKEEGQFLVEFDSETQLKEAQAVLKRKFDFVESTPRRVGVVQFDNLADYSKVLEYMNKQGMMIECSGEATLDEDAEIEEGLNVELDQAPSIGRSYAARPRGSNALSGMDVFENREARSIVVRKRWK